MYLAVLPQLLRGPFESVTGRVPGRGADRGQQAHRGGTRVNHADVVLPAANSDGQRSVHKPTTRQSSGPLYVHWSLTWLLGGR